MNLPLALTALLMKDAMSLDDAKDGVLSEAQGALKEFLLAVEDDEDEEV